MSNIGQTIIIRTDLFSLPDDVGLLSAQVAHIHMECVRKMIINNMVREENFIPIKLTKEHGVDVLSFMDWVRDPYLFVKQVPNKESLKHFSKLVHEAGLPLDEWYDTVYIRLSKTMKQAFPNVLVGISIGPCDADKIRTVVGDLPLL